eukprot:6209906-Pleurochrysis_carterae.AAC.1
MVGRSSIQARYVSCEESHDDLSESVSVTRKCYQLSTRVLASWRATRAVRGRATCRTEGGGRLRAPLRRVCACVGRGVGERRRENLE